MTIAGLYENRLKKLNGLKLTLPAAFMVLAKAIGLGAIAYCSQFILSVNVRSFTCSVSTVDGLVALIAIFFPGQYRKIAFFFYYSI